MMEKMTFETSDLTQATLLRLSGLKLAGMRKEGKVVYFLFEDDPKKRQQVMTELINDTLSLSPRQYQALRDELKKMVYHS